ncbi:Beta-propeller domains of methanol dehydrogenase type [hydrothermal vent metagenome]|uniref:Beta-propeller domains of methanol dehydrogenase type n=1 Tax=hydrothermal vent metagenome TaxID=652676 RepID=A0A1W1BUV7_9ZZZZ
MKKFLTLFTMLFMLSYLHGANIYPQPQDDYVNDYAQVLSPSDSTKIYKMFEDLEYQTGIEAVVVTINSMEDYETTDNTINSFATNLFNNWGIGHKDKNDGVLILVSIQDRKCRIELGAGYSGQYNSDMKQIIDNQMIPYFKTENYSQGITQGAKSVISKITKQVTWLDFYKWHIALGVLIIIGIFVIVSLFKSGKKGWGWMLLLVVGGLLAFLIKLIIFGFKIVGFAGGFSVGGGATGEW